MNIQELYSDKLKQFGPNDFRSLNWGSKEGTSAKSRYNQMGKYVDFKNHSVLEIGCGWGSFFDFGFKCKEYFGVDINEDFIQLAREKYPNKLWAITPPNDQYFRNRDHHRFDICISSGVAGNRGGPAWNPPLLKEYLNSMYAQAHTVLVNFPSNRADIRSEYVEYFSPEYVLGEALNITYNTQIIHKSKADFLLILKHD